MGRSRWDGTGSEEVERSKWDGMEWSGWRLERRRTGSGSGSGSGRLDQEMERHFLS